VTQARSDQERLCASKSKGRVTLWWSRYAPAVFRGNRLLELVAGGEIIDHLTVQESIAA